MYETAINKGRSSRFVSKDPQAVQFAMKCIAVMAVCVAVIAVCVISALHVKANAGRNKTILSL